ncbi:hypothetical protein V6N11_031958 [Hibiscus sabdariffa]|uniref:Uncharacterized protein n=1 Tax=Hibiscus sabdariffa TaxID=183260 RepID=A0ABR2SZY4_9ROSI
MYFVSNFSGFYLLPGQTQLSEPPWSWNGRIWARTGCKFDSNWQPACETGDCDGRLGHISPSCTSRGYSKNLNNLCPQELQVVNKNGEVVACKSSFLAFDTDLFCCRNEFGTPENTNGTCIQRYLKVVYCILPSATNKSAVAQWLKFNSEFLGSNPGCGNIFSAVEARRSCPSHHGRGMDEFRHGRVASLTRIGNRLVKPTTVMEGSATLVQVALQGDKGKPNFYDVNLVDGYNLPVSVATRPFSLKCTIRGYSKNLNN